MAKLGLGDGRTRLMGVVNVTPDSFFDGGRHSDTDAAVAHAEALVAAGADILDIGGESTRPGHAPVSDVEQIARVEPVIAAVRARVAVPLSVDTTRATVARAALDAGADWINDTLALRDDPDLGPLVAERGCPIVLMHRFDPPRQRATGPRGRDLVERIAAALAERVQFARRCGIAAANIWLDPGIGFGTLPEDNTAIHAWIEPLRALGHPLLYGPSRKSFLGYLTGKDADDRLCATAASVATLALGGVDVVRVHDVAEMRDVVAVADAIRLQRTEVDER